MSRFKSKKLKSFFPDSRYRKIIITKFINYLMLKGKKSVAERVFYCSVRKFFYMINKYSIKVFNDIVSTLRPFVEVKSRRIGGATYQVPIEVSMHRSLILSLRWLVTAARSRKTENKIVNKLACEFFDVYNKEGIAYKKKISTHKIAESNKAFTHYRW